MATESDRLLAKLNEIDAERAKAERAAEVASQKALEMQHQGDAVRVALRLLDIEVPDFDRQAARSSRAGTRGRKRSGASVTGLVRAAIGRLPHSTEFDADDIFRAVENDPASEDQSITENAIRKALARLVRDEPEHLIVLRQGSGRAKSLYMKPAAADERPHDAARRSVTDDVPIDRDGWSANRATA